MAGQDDLTQYSTWYVALLAAGALIAVPAVTVGNDDAFLIGLGLLLIGVGEFICHPFQQTVHFDDYGRATGTVSGRRRQWKPAGILVDLIGGVLLAVGLYRILAM